MAPFLSTDMLSLGQAALQLQSPQNFVLDQQSVNLQNALTPLLQMVA